MGKKAKWKKLRNKIRSLVKKMDKLGFCGVVSVTDYKKTWYYNMLTTKEDEVSYDHFVLDMLREIVLAWHNQTHSEKDCLEFKK